MNMDIAHNPSQHIGETSNDMTDIQNNVITQQLDMTFNSSMLEDFSCAAAAMEEEEEEEEPEDDLFEDITFEKLISSTPIENLTQQNDNDDIDDHAYDDVEIKIEESQLQTQIFNLNQFEEKEEEADKQESAKTTEEKEKSEIENEHEKTEGEIFFMEDSDSETTKPTSVTVIKKESFEHEKQQNHGEEEEEEEEENKVDELSLSPLNLSNSLVDHNYSSLLDYPNAYTLRNYLNQHLKDKLNIIDDETETETETEMKLNEFVEEIVSSINSFNINKDKYEITQEQLHFELFVQKVIDSVMQKDESQYLKYENDNNDHKVENTEENIVKLIDEKSEILNYNEIPITEPIQQNDNDNNDNKNNLVVLDKLMKFGENLQKKCNSLIITSSAAPASSLSSSSSSIDQVTNFVQMQLEELKNLINNNNNTTTSKTIDNITTKCEISVQTEPSKKALRRMKKEQERQSKFKLENDTSGSSSSSSDSSDSCNNSSSTSTSNGSSMCSKSSCDKLIHETKKNKKRMKQEKMKKISKNDENTLIKLDTTNINMDVDQDIDEAKENKQCIKNNDNATDDIDEEDKEIERLINIDGLLKRPKYMPGSSVLSKNLENSKQKVKSLAKDLLLDESNSEDDESDEDEAKASDEDEKLAVEKLKKLSNTCNGEEDLARHATVDDESEKEIITEKEYLKRYNDSLKQHFLNDSSSMSEDTSEVELIKGLCPEEDNAEDVVDKFLESYDAECDEFAQLSEDEEDNLEAEEKEKKDNETVEKSKQANNSLKDVNDTEKNKEMVNDGSFDDNDNDDDDDEMTAKQKNSDLKTSLSEFIQLPKSPIEATVDTEISGTTSPADKLDENNKKDECGSTVESNLSSSDCELLNDTTLLTKTKKTKKSLETMLTEAEKRKKASKVDSSDLISLSSASSSDGNSDAEDGEGSGPGHQSRVIKPMLRQDQLASETRRAQKLEADRIRRLDKKQASLSKLLKERDAKNEKRADKEHELILDYNSETKTFIKVHPHIVKQLKSHQIDGIKFMYDSCYGGVDALKKSTGSGCILAHCMGLGKTLQLIALLHTVISYKELKTNKILVLCPKSTVMNWADEIIRWLGPLNAKNLKVFTFSDTS